jgi:hypothetical protein
MAIADCGLRIADCGFINSENPIFITSPLQDGLPAINPQSSLFLVVNRRQFDDLERAYAVRCLNLYLIAFFLIQ